MALYLTVPFIFAAARIALAAFTYDPVAHRSDNNTSWSVPSAFYFFSGSISIFQDSLYYLFSTQCGKIRSNDSSYPAMTGDAILVPSANSYRLLGHCAVNPDTR